MKCSTVSTSAGTAIFCGPRPRAKRCHCGSPGTRLCDWKVGDGTCNAAICHAHAYPVGPNKHLCHEHQIAYREWLAGRGARERPRPAEHLCHAEGCTLAVPPRLLMCRRHWRMVPSSLQNDVWRQYRPGQETDKRPSLAYQRAAEAAIAAVAALEQRVAPAQLALLAR
jgi:hypothetical protein